MQVVALMMTGVRVYACERAFVKVVERAHCLPDG